MPDFYEVAEASQNSIGACIFNSFSEIMYLIGFKSYSFIYNVGYDNEKERCVAAE
mgnify:CR=1 FL=1